MLSATPPSKGNRRSTRVGRHQGSGGRGSRRSGGASSWRPSDKSARKWVQVMRPPGPGARFVIPTWVPCDELTPEEAREMGNTEMTAADANAEEKGLAQQPNDTVEGSAVATTSESVDKDEAAPMESTPAANETADTEMAPAVTVSAIADATENAKTFMATENETIKEEMKEPVASQEQAVASMNDAVTPKRTDATVTTEMSPLDLLVNTAMDTEPVAADAKTSGDDQKEVEKPSQPNDNTRISEALETGGELTEDSKPAALGPLNVSRDTSTSEGIPFSEGDVAKALESVEGFEELRPHDPIADTLADTASAPPSRPISEPATIFMKEHAAPDSVIYPVPVSAPSTQSAAAAPVADAASEESSHFVHSESENAPFHSPTVALSKEVNDAKEEPPTATSDTSDDQLFEPESKRPRLE